MSTATLPVLDDTQLDDLFDLDVRIKLDEANSVEAGFTSIGCSFTCWSTFPTQCGC
ncbi:FDLD family class I lanthipeptide [Streptomyces monashensis]|uniref:FDLD family class I lanthipeptide n=1 Tax=Streptomyces monashensis TaxID=1678012 RepID=UPI0015A572A9|nr:FDLD family class I lanthipeptide [Streptomyces monashensis]